MSDATERSLEKFDDDKLWDLVETDVPIFVTHDCYRKKKESTDGKVNYDHAVVAPGQKPNGEGWEFFYSVDDRTLHDIADEINRQWEDFKCPVKLFAGHTKDPWDQTDQPPLVGYGAFGAKVGKWTKKNGNAVFLKKQFIRKGCGTLAKELPERSPEFKPATNSIRGIALLKTDPRLSMGFTIYARSDGAVLYMQGAEHMPDPTTMPPSATEEKKKAEEALATKTPPPPVSDDGGINEEEKSKFMKYMAACYPKTHSAEHGETVKNGLAAPSATNGALPPPLKKPGEETVPMHDPIRPVVDPKAAADLEILKLQMDSQDKKLAAITHAQEWNKCKAIIYGLVHDEGYAFSQPSTEIEALMPLNEQQRDARVKYIKDNYVQNYANADPTSHQNWIPVAESPTGPDGGGGPRIGREDVNAVVRYAEDNDLDVNKAEDYEKCVAAVRKAKRGR